MLPIYKIVLGDSEGLQVMSLVEFPAVETDFLAFSKQEDMKFSIDEEQHIVFGVALRANFPIYRFDQHRGEYYVVFDDETIQQLYQKFMIEKRTAQVNLEHNQMVDGVYLIQSFIKNTEKGISPVGFEDIEDGSWFCSYKIQNEDVWNRVKSGEFRGFSVEGWFELEETKDDLEVLVDELLG